MSNFHKFNLGEFKAVSLVGKSEVIDIREEMKQVPEDQLLAAMQQCGYKDFNTKIGFNNLFIQTPEHKILIDCGTGQDQLLESLAKAEIKPGSIDYLIITHSDFDHIGGLDDFKNAKIVFPRLAYDLWTNELSRKKMIDNFQEVFLKFLPADFVAKGVEYRENYGTEKLLSLRNRIMLVQDEETFLPGFQLIHTPGHRPDHFAVQIESKDETLIHIADGFRHCIQVDHPDWYTRFDSYPKQMAESLELILQMAKDKKALLYGAHFTFPGLATFENNQFKFITH